MRVPRRLRLNRRFLILVLALASSGLVLLLFDRGERSAAPADDEVAIAAYRQTRAAQAEVRRLGARMDDLELRLKVVEAGAGYTTANGTHVPPVPDPLAPTNVSQPY